MASANQGVQRRRKPKYSFRGNTIQLMRLYPKATRSDEGMASVARVYADVNENKPQEYWDYENYSIEWRYVCILHRLVYGEMVYEGRVYSDVGVKTSMKSSKRWVEVSTVRSLKGLIQNLMSFALLRY